MGMIVSLYASMFRPCKVIEEANTGGFPVRNPKPLRLPKLLNLNGRSRQGP